LPACPTPSGASCCLFHQTNCGAKLLLMEIDLVDVDALIKQPRRLLMILSGEIRNRIDMFRVKDADLQRMIGAIQMLSGPERDRALAYLLILRDTRSISAL
jgi:hypothetical protein